MEQDQNIIESGEMIIKSLEYQIKNNRFSTKEQLVEHIMNLKNNGVSPITLNNEKIQELLNLFDSLNKKDEMPRDMQKYTSIGLENQDLIVSTETDSVLKTSDGTSTFSNEFKGVQKEIIDTEQDGMINADAVFEHMANYQKEKMMAYESREYKPKVRTRKMEHSRYMDNAAFTKVSFLVIIILTFAILITMIILTNK